MHNMYMLLHKSRNPYEIQVNTKRVLNGCAMSNTGYRRNPYEIQVNTKPLRTLRSKPRRTVVYVVIPMRFRSIQRRLVRQRHLSSWVVIPMRFRSIQRWKKRTGIMLCQPRRNPYEIQVNTKAPESFSPKGWTSKRGRNPYEIQVNTKLNESVQDKVTTGNAVVIPMRFRSIQSAGKGSRAYEREQAS